MSTSAAAPAAPFTATRTPRSLSAFSLAGKVCAVTGAARGLGNVMARAFIESGASDLAILDLDRDVAAGAAREIDEYFVSEGLAQPGELTVVGIGCDVADEASVARAFTDIKEVFGGRLDVLVTAAGIVENFTAQEYPTAKVQKLMDINVMGTWHCALAAEKLMEGKGGSIIMIGSMSGNVSRGCGSW